jgi:hypothetical protein
MKKLLAIAALLSVASLSFSWERRGSDVVFESRPLGVSQVEPIPVISEDVEYGPVVVERTYPTYSREYRPVRGVVRGAATAAEGVVEGTAEAVGSLVP